ncbi:MAG: 2-hydroxy-3-oxopropionate reductase [Verrucomicrobiota bacterium]|jgi:3-hydroxyisobutyrate dehydrogenase
MRVGFIGTGVMGASMARHILEAGHTLAVHNRTRHKAAPLNEAGAHWCDTPGEVAACSDLVITIAGYPADVEALYFGPSNLLEAARPGMVFIDMTTSSPVLAKRIAAEAAARGAHGLDAPVSGGDIGAREARLTIMVGGDHDGFELAKPIFVLLGKNISYQGPAGSGQLCKLANQIAIASGMIGVCEAFAFAESAGLDARRVLTAIAAGAAGSWSLSNLAPRFLDGNFEPGFYVKHFVKDLGLAIEAAREMQLDLPGLEQAKALYQRLASNGFAEEGTQALYRLYRD